MNNKLMTMIALAMFACGKEAREPAAELQHATSVLALQTCTASCDPPTYNGQPISCTATSCSATAGSVTCNGNTTYCSTGGGGCTPRGCYPGECGVFDDGCGGLTYCSDCCYQCPWGVCSGGCDCCESNAQCGSGACNMY